MVKKPTQEKEKSEFKPVKLRLKLTLCHTGKYAKS